MHFSQFLLGLPFALYASVSIASPLDRVKRECNVTSTKSPKNFGVIIFPAIEIQDIYAAVDPLQLMAFQRQLNLYYIAETLDPVSSAPLSAATNTHNSSFWPVITPTHTFDTAPNELDVLIVPGGPGARNPNVTAITDFIAKTYPSLQNLITICTGAGLAAQSGVLDGKRVTTNKSAWETMKAMGPDVLWVAPARWVVDGNIWSSSGVTAGIDLIYAFITEKWGAENATWAQGLTEYVPHDQCYDPFSARYNVTSEYRLDWCEDSGSA